jgi:FlaA1/EpsC-like NDP-sugar epimerase
MTRFNISLKDSVEMVLYSLEHAWGGELFVPKIPSYRITDMAKAIGPSCEHPVIGMRPGEKIHEEMITTSDSFSTYDIGDYYVILPAAPYWKLSDYIRKFNAKKVQEGFTYNSGTNTEWLTVEDLRKLIFEDNNTEFSN